MSFKSYADRSRRDWGHSDEKTTIEEIQLGATLRIADAVEKVAQNYDSLLRAKRSAEESRDHWRKRAEQLERQRRSLRGTITRMKRAALAGSRPMTNEEKRATDKFFLDQFKAQGGAK